MVNRGIHFSPTYTEVTAIVCQVLTGLEGPAQAMQLAHLSIFMCSCSLVHGSMMHTWKNQADRAYHSGSRVIKDVQAYPVRTMYKADRTYHHGSRIINGSQAFHRDHPFVVIIEEWEEKIERMGEGRWEGLCSGSIINAVTVLTACHCAVEDQLYEAPKALAKPEDRRIIAGTAYAEKNTPTKQVVGVDKIVVHPKCENYDKLNMDFVNDVALFFLNTSLKYSVEIKPIRFANTDILTSVKQVNNLIQKNEWCTTMGWGRSSPEEKAQSPVLLSSNVQLLAPEECSRRFCKMIGSHCDSDFNAHGQFCIASPKAADCFGDSGGPLICRGYLVGIVSYGEKCEPNLPVVFQGLRPILEILKYHHVHIEGKGSGAPKIDTPYQDITENQDTNSSTGVEHKPVLAELKKIRYLLTVLVQRNDENGVQRPEPDVKY